MARLETRIFAILSVLTMVTLLAIGGLGLYRAARPGPGAMVPSATVVPSPSATPSEPTCPDLSWGAKGFALPATLVGKSDTLVPAGNPEATLCRYALGGRDAKGAPVLIGSRAVSDPDPLLTMLRGVSVDKKPGACTLIGSTFAQATVVMLRYPDGTTAAVLQTDDPNSCELPTNGAFAGGPYLGRELATIYVQESAKLAGQPVEQAANAWGRGNAADARITIFSCDPGAIKVTETPGMVTLSGWTKVPTKCASPGEISLPLEAPLGERVVVNEVLGTRVG